MLGLNGSRQPNRQMVTRSVGEPLQLDCGEFSSVPEASITWVRRNPLTNIQKGSLGDNVVTSISGLLYFRSLEASHNDLYECSILNRVTGTTVVGSYILSVNGKIYTVLVIILHYLNYSITSYARCSTNCITTKSCCCKSGS